MKDAPESFKLPKSESLDIWRRLPRHKWFKHLGPRSKIQWFFLNEICMVTYVPDYCGKDNVKKFGWNIDGKKRGEARCISWKVNSASTLWAQLIACGRLASLVKKKKKTRWSQMVLTQCGFLCSAMNADRGDVNSNKSGQAAGVNTTSHRTQITQANIFSRLAQAEFTLCSSH